MLMISVLLSTLIISLPVSAYSYSGIHWGVNTVYYDISSLPADWQTDIMMAASTWNAAGSDFRLYPSSTSNNDVIRRWEQYNYDLAWSIVSASNNIITDCDMIFNLRYGYTFFTSGTAPYRVRSVALHELGHWLMLNHNLISTSIMYGTYYMGYLSLDPDDIAGIQYIY
mgnify:CR=1 FL=1